MDPAAKGLASSPRPCGPCVKRASKSPLNSRVFSSFVGNVFRKGSRPTVLGSALIPSPRREARPVPFILEVRIFRHPQAPIDAYDIHPFEAQSSQRSAERPARLLPWPKQNRTKAHHSFFPSGLGRNRHPLASGFSEMPVGKDRPRAKTPCPGGRKPTNSKKIIVTSNYYLSRVQRKNLPLFR